jgi:hypothetical protein
MCIETVRGALLWCAVINYGLLLLWFLPFTLPHGWMYRLWSRWFRLPAEQFDGLNYALMGMYKMGILMFNLIPYVALLVVGPP